MERRARRAERRAMVQRDLARRDIADRRVLAAMASVPREYFVPDHHAHDAYADRPLTIGHGQTISQPYIVALMTQAARLTRHSRVLDVGTGSGYHAAILARLAAEVWSLERVPALAGGARRRLAALHVRNVRVLTGDGTAGYPPSAPFDAVIVAAAAREPPPALLRQLAVGGRLVMPVGPSDIQELVVFERCATGIHQHALCSCFFVPLLTGNTPTA
jgi:protein-L-isoaspartate(D-aspartate) O-methyltransferase